MLLENEGDSAEMTEPKHCVVLSNQERSKGERTCVLYQPQAGAPGQMPEPSADPQTLVFLQVQLGNLQADLENLLMHLKSFWELGLLLVHNCHAAKESLNQ